MNHYKGVLDGLIYREDLGPEDGLLELNPYSEGGKKWVVAEDYYVEGDYIRAGEVGELPRQYDPLLDPDLLVSFLRLGKVEATEIYSDKAERRALAWVKKYGLPDKKEDSHRLITKGEVNQRPLKVVNFIEDAREARHLTLLHKALKSGDFEGLTKQSTILHEDSEYRKLTRVEEFIRVRWRNMQGVSPSHISRIFVPWATGTFIQQFIAEKLSAVDVTVSSKKLLPEYADPFGGGSHPYSGFVFRWQDLRDAIYLQLALVLADAKPIRICANPSCRTPFPLTRKDRRVCGDGCRSSNRPARRKKS